MNPEAGPSKLRAPSLAMLDGAELIKQGAEAVCLLVFFPNPKPISKTTSLPMIYNPKSNPNTVAEH
jgi:hypothetical protein